MSEDRLNRLEVSMASLAKNFSEYLAIESARKEREKHQEALNDKFELFIEDYKEKDKPVIDSSRRWQATGFWWLTRVILPAMIIAILTSAGVNIYGDAKSSSVKEVKSSGNK